MEHAGNTIVALLTGALVGAGVALLYAPDKGENTREKLSSEAKRAKSKFDKQFHETTDRLSKSARKAKVEFDSKLEETLSSASYKADDVLGALEVKLAELRAKNARMHKDTQEREMVAKTKNAIA